MLSDFIYLLARFLTCILTMLGAPFRKLSNLAKPHPKPLTAFAIISLFSSIPIIYLSLAGNPTTNNLAIYRATKLFHEFLIKSAWKVFSYSYGRSYINALHHYSAIHPGIDPNHLSILRRNNPVRAFGGAVNDWMHKAEFNTGPLLSHLLFKPD